jgi:hypothetical protein
MPVMRALLIASACLLLVTSAANGSSERERDSTTHQTPEIPVVPSGSPAVELPDDPSYPGEMEIRALAAAYPQRISAFGIRDGEWAVRMNNRWYYWANGAMLLEELRDRADEYVGIRFYNYRLGAPYLRQVPLEMDLMLRDHAAVLRTDTRLGSTEFLDNLYGISSSADGERQMVRVFFLGYTVRVHPWVAKPLQLVHQEIMKRAAADQELSTWIDALRSIHAYNWRSIAGTVRRSYHSYGVAIDLEPSTYNGRWTYWRWASENGVEWWTLPLDQRWQVPQAVIDAFERNGFIWGGKWLQFDNIHFEYRPESIILARWREYIGEEFYYDD